MMTAPLFPDVIVNGEPIPHKLIAAEAQHHKAPRNKPGLAWRQAATALVIRALMVQEARRQQIKAEPAELSPGRFETDEEALISALLQREIVVEPPREAEIRAVYDRTPERFCSPPLWEVSHILIACDPGDPAASQAAEAEARSLCQKVLRAPQSFADLAAEFSDCDSKAAGGTLGQIGPKDVVPEFAHAVAALAPGEISPEPVQTRFGWHILRLDASAQGQPLPYATVRDQIALRMEQSAWSRAAQALVTRLAEAAEIEGVDRTCLTGPGELQPGPRSIS